jgi:hypothetical protein
MPFIWTIEYWKNQGKTVECFSNADGDWLDAPNDNVLYVYHQWYGIPPYGNPSKLYTIRHKGFDKYYMYEPGDGSVYIGGFNLMTASHEPGNGRIHRYFPDGTLDSIGISDGMPVGPVTIPGGMIKNGIWLSEPWATKVGLTTPDSTREMAPCAGHWRQPAQ